MPKDSPRGGESMHSDPLFQGTFYEPNIYFFPRSTDSKDLCAFDVRERVDERNFSKRNDIRVAIAENTETWVEEEGTKQKKRILSNVSIFDASDAPAIYTRKTIVSIHCRSNSLKIWELIKRELNCRYLMEM